jgi:hypothetical protein
MLEDSHQQINKLLRQADPLVSLEVLPEVQLSSL